MERLKAMKEQLTSLVQSELSHCETADTHELGEAVDMIKDLAETMYYCTITEAMEGQDKKEPRYYSGRRYPVYYNPMVYPQRDIDRPYGRMYYSDGNIRNQGGSRNSGGNSSTVGANSYYGEMMPYMDEYPIEMRDYREGRSPIARKMYMESKEMHQDPAAQMKELEHYIKELGDDVTEMIQDSTPEQKAILKQKISALAEKIV